MRYAILGFGTAGYHAVKAIRRFDQAGEIDVYSDTGKAPYNPMLTTYYVTGKLNYEGMFPYGSLEEIQSQLSFTLYHETVLKLHAADRTVETNIATRAYDKILISSGARAFSPPVPGLPAENSYVMRTSDDAELLKSRLAAGDVKSAVVMGASMTSIKVVELLNKAGIDTWMLGRSPYIFPRAAYPETSIAIQSRIEKHGVHMHFGASIDHVESENGQQIVVLTDGMRLNGDIVLLCTGTRTNVEFAKDELTINSGIVVNTRMETSAEGIYAAGDCCEGCNLQNGKSMVIGLWANANHQGDVAGANMAGHPDEYDGNILHNITHFMDMDFIGFGDNRIQGEVLEYGNPDDGLYIRIVIDAGKIAGVNILDNYRISGIVKNFMLRLFSGEKASIPDFQRGKLIKAGLSNEFINTLEEKLNG